jgi:hypothetical protein
MKYYAGLDVSQQTTSICIVDEEAALSPNGRWHRVRTQLRRRWSRLP